MVGRDRDFCFLGDLVFVGGGVLPLLVRAAAALMRACLETGSGAALAFAVRWRAHEVGEGALGGAPSVLWVASGGAVPAELRRADPPRGLPAALPRREPAELSVLLTALNGRTTTSVSALRTRGWSSCTDADAIDATGAGRPRRGLAPPAVVNPDLRAEDATQGPRAAC